MDLSPSMAAALAFLRARRSRSGWWRDFYTLAGPSDAWVTAYVGSALATLPDPWAAQAARHAWRRLRRRRWWASGWGYNGRVPADADSTLWALRLADSLQITTAGRVERAYRFLGKHVRPQGGMATYASDGPIRLFTRLNPSVSFDGWCGPHTCVSASAAALPGFPQREKILAFLGDRQASDGSWASYWWCDREYATAQAAQALTLSPSLPDAKQRIQKSIDWACQRLGSEGAVTSKLYPHGSPFATAWAASILCLSDPVAHVRDALQQAATWLLDHQQADGSWPRSATLRIPPPPISNPDNFDAWKLGDGGGTATILTDRHAIFTTATVLRTLQSVQQRLNGSGRAVPF